MDNYIKFPVISKQSVSVYPHTNLCPTCGQNKVFEPDSFIFINGGALKRSGQNSLSMCNELSGFLNIIVHGSHNQGIGLYRNIHIDLPIVADATNGQFDIHFCSLECLQTFFNQIIQTLALKLHENA